jgi:rare lipoprotein A (peptidoglycan hydrolase)
VPSAQKHADHQREKDGTLEANEAEVRQPYVVPRHRLVFAVWLTVLALPLLVLDNIPRTEARAASVRTDAPRMAETTTTESTTTTTIVASTTVVADDVAASPETTVATAPVTTAPRPKATTVKAPPPSTTTTTTAPPNVERGGASWYDYRPGECAHKTLPRGTVVTIRSLENGASTTCVVTDRGPYQAGRIIDLDRATFAQLKDPSLGVVQVEISW